MHRAADAADDLYVLKIIFLLPTGGMLTQRWVWF